MSRNPTIPPTEEQVFKKYYPILISWATGKFPNVNSEDIEDCLQETFIVVLKKKGVEKYSHQVLATGEGLGRLKIMFKRKIFDCVRKIKRQLIDSEAEVEGCEGDSICVDNIKLPGQGPSRLKIALNVLKENLTPLCFKVFLLKNGDEKMSTMAIAKKVNITKEAVYQHTHRAKKVIKALFKKGLL